MTGLRKLSYVSVVAVERLNDYGLPYLSGTDAVCGGIDDISGMGSLALCGIEMGNIEASGRILTRS